MNPENLKPALTTEEAAARGSRGGKASVQARRKKKALVDALKAILYQPSPSTNGNLILDDIVFQAVSTILTNPTMKDLETLQRLLGEYNQSLSVESKVDLQADVKARVKQELFQLPTNE